MTAGLLIHALLILLPLRVAAQDLAEWPNQHFLPHSEPVPLELASTLCLTEMQPMLTWPVAENSCHVESVEEIGSIDRSRWFLARYRRTMVQRPDSGPDETFDMDEFVFMRSGTDTLRLTPVWHVQSERMTEFLEWVRVRQRPEGLLFELVTCLNGTGGCSHDFLLDDGTGLRILKLPHIDELVRQLPQSHQLRYGNRLNLSTLGGLWPVAGPADPDCCPSLMFIYDVEVVEGRMELVRAELVPMDEQRWRELGSAAAGPLFGARPRIP